MNKEISIKKNYIYNTLYQIVTMLIPIVTAPYLSRIFGANGVGIYSYTSSVVAIFILIATFGTASYGQRELAMIRDDRYNFSKTFWEIEILNIFITFITLLLWIGFIFISTKYSNYYLILTFQIIAVTFDITWLYGAYENFKTITIRNSLVKIIGLILTFVLVNSVNDLIIYIAIISISTLVGNISTWIGINKLVDKVPLKVLEIKKHFKQTFIYFVPALATSIYTVLDKTMIGFITKDELESGYYEQATKIISIAKTLIFSFNTIMYSKMSYFFAKKNYSKLKEFLNKSLEFICLISISLTFGTIAIASNFVPLFFGSGYDKVIILIYILSPIIFIVGISNFIGTQYLTPIGKRLESSKVIILGAVINFSLNLILIPIYSSIGAVIASIIAELIITILYIHMSDGYINYKAIIINSYKKIISASIMLIIVLLIGKWLESSVLSVGLQVVIGAIIYLLILVILKDESLRNLIKE